MKTSPLSPTALRPEIASLKPVGLRGRGGEGGGDCDILRDSSTKREFEEGIPGTRNKYSNSDTSQTKPNHLQTGLNLKGTNYSTVHVVRYNL